MIKNFEVCGLSDVEKGEKLSYCWPVEENIKKESETVKNVLFFNYTVDSLL